MSVEEVTKHAQRLESTYKELKHELQTAVDPVQNRLESTYKELKRNERVGFPPFILFRVYL